MIHEIKINGVDVKVNIYCDHPDLENNSCPLNGDCKNCGYCKVTMSCEDFFAIKEGKS